jgi:hypothetical protein
VCNEWERVWKEVVMTDLEELPCQFVHRGLEKP